MRATGWAVTWTEHGEEKRQEFRQFPGAYALQQNLLAKGLKDAAYTVITGPDLPRPVGLPTPRKTRRPYERETDQEEGEAV